MALPASRAFLDLDLVHCSVPIRALSVPKTVFVNGLPWSCFGDINLPHLLPCPPACCVHVFPMVTGTPMTFVQGVPSGTVLQKTCTMVITGSPNVFAGPP